MKVARAPLDLAVDQGTMTAIGEITIVPNPGLIVMAGIGRFKLSDALPKSSADSSRAGRNGGKKKSKVGDAELPAEQLREASLAKNSEAGRAGQQTGRLRTGGGRGK